MNKTNHIDLPPLPLWECRDCGRLEFADPPQETWIRSSRMTLYLPGRRVEPRNCPQDNVVMDFIASPDVATVFEAIVQHLYRVRFGGAHEQD